jgi:hypothetical protein
VDDHSIQRRIETAHPSFINRNVIFAERNMIVI